MKTLIAMIAALCAFQCPVLWAAESEQDKKDHDELRALLKTFAEAFNTRNLDPLTPHLHKNFTVTMINQDLVTNPSELKGYLDKQFTGPGAILKDVKIKPDADIPAIFLDGRIGINRGSSVDTYALRDGRVFTLNTRWTGTAIKEDDKWKVLNAHIGLNIIDNPILDAMEKMKWMWAAGGLVLGLIAGFFGARMMRKPA